MCLNLIQLKYDVSYIAVHTISSFSWWSNHRMFGWVPKCTKNKRIPHCYEIRYWSYEIRYWSINLYMNTSICGHCRKRNQNENLFILLVMLLFSSSSKFKDNEKLPTLFLLLVSFKGARPFLD